MVLASLHNKGGLSRALYSCSSVIALQPRLSIRAFGGAQAATVPEDLELAQEDQGKALPKALRKRRASTKAKVPSRISDTRILRKKTLDSNTTPKESNLANLSRHNLIKHSEVLERRLRRVRRELALKLEAEERRLKSERELVEAMHHPLILSVLQKFQQWALKDLEEKVQAQDLKILTLEAALRHLYSSKVGGMQRSTEKQSQGHIEAAVSVPPLPPLPHSFSLRDTLKGPPVKVGYQDLQAFEGLSSVQMGKVYETVVTKALSHCGIAVSHCGKTGDQGIDFRGHWDSKPRSSTPSLIMEEANSGEERRRGIMRIPVIGQCKSSRKSKAFPLYIRDFITALGRELPGTLGIFCCNLGYSSGCVSEWRYASVPIVLAVINGNGVLKGWMQNGAAMKLLHHHPSPYLPHWALEKEKEKIG